MVVTFRLHFRVIVKPSELFTSVLRSHLPSLADICRICDELGGGGGGGGGGGAALHPTSPLATPLSDLYKEKNQLETEVRIFLFLIKI
jgi:hypothetical protein